MVVSCTSANTNLLESGEDSAEREGGRERERPGAEAETTRVSLNERTGSHGMFSRTKFRKQRGNEFQARQKTDAKETRD